MMDGRRPWSSFSRSNDKVPTMFSISYMEGKSEVQGSLAFSREPRQSILNLDGARVVSGMMDDLLSCTYHTS